MAGIKDVAKRAGVSISTVSRYINRTAYVEEEKGKAIQEAMEFYKYAPSQFGRGLKVQKTGLIGVCFSGTAQSSVFDSSYGVELLRGVESVTRDLDYSIVILNEKSSYRENESSLPQYMTFVREKKIDGLLLSGVTSREVRERTLVELYEFGFPMVYIGRRFHDMGMNVYAGFTDYHAEMVRILHELGHRTVTFLMQIHEAYRNEVEEEIKKILPGADNWVDLLPGSFSEEELEERLLYWIREKKVTGISSPAMEVTSMIYQILRRNGLSVPEDISVISVESRMGEGEELFPRADAFVTPTFDMGAQAAGMLVDAIKGREVQKQSVKMDARYIRRDSLRRARADQQDA